MAKSKQVLTRRIRNDYDSTLRGVIALLEEARRASVRSVNAVMTGTYWQIGKRIIEGEQKGAARAGYGEGLMESLSVGLTRRFGRGFSRRNLEYMRLFYLSRQTIGIAGSFVRVGMNGREKTQMPSAELARMTGEARKTQMPSAELKAISPSGFPLPWSHYVRLLSVKDEAARSFYEAEALRGGWSVKQLDRQISTLFYERVALSRNKPSMLQRATAPDESAPDAADIKEPFILEFLGLKDEYSESDLEEALIRHLESFLLELGDDFAFVGRQRRLRIGNKWYRIDLLFFHRRLRCLVVIDLKLGELAHADIGQMHMYLNFARENWARPDEGPPVGLILCSEKDDAIARYTLENLPNKIMAAEYKMKLPDERLLVAEIEKTRENLETRAVGRPGAKTGRARKRSR